MDVIALNATDIRIDARACVLNEWRHTVSTSLIRCRRSSGRGAEATSFVDVALIAMCWKLRVKNFCMEKSRHHSNTGSHMYHRVSAGARQLGHGVCIPVPGYLGSSEGHGLGVSAARVLTVLHKAIWMSVLAFGRFYSAIGHCKTYAGICVRLGTLAWRSAT